MLTILLILIIITLTYHIAVWDKFGVPESISDTSYCFMNYNSRNWIFTIYCFITAFLLAPLWFSVTNPTWQFLVFFGCGGVLFAGATPFFKQSLEAPIHYTSGCIAFVAFVIWLILEGYWLFLIIEFLLSLLLFIIDRKNIVYYVESISLVGLIIILTLILT